MQSLFPSSEVKISQMSHSSGHWQTKTLYAYLIYLFYEEVCTSIIKNQNMNSIESKKGAYLGMEQWGLL